MEKGRLSKYAHKRDEDRGCFVCSKSCEKNSTESLTPLKMFLRYLKIDHRQFSKNIEEGDIEISVERDNVGVDMCQECFERMNEFWQLYQDMDRVKLAIDKCIQCFRDVMIKTDGSVITKEGSQKCRLREDIIKKCALKLQYLPRVELEKIILPISSPATKTDSKGDDPDFEVLDQASSSEEDFEDDNEHDNDWQEEEALEAPSRRKRKPKADGTFAISVFNKCSSTGSCDYCDFKTIHKRNVKKHLLQTHPMELYPDQIPPASTQMQLQEAITETVDKSMKDPRNINKNKNVCCIDCNKILPQRPSLKLHVIEFHFDKIVDTLKENQEALATPVEPRPPRRVWPKNCEYCDHKSTDSRYIRKHVILMHTNIMYEDQLPPGVTQPEVYDAVTVTIEENTEILEDDPNQNHIGCKICDKKFQTRKALRFHFISCHLEIIIENLNRSGGGSEDGGRIQIVSKTSLAPPPPPPSLAPLSIPMDFKVEVGGIQIHYQEAEPDSQVEWDGMPTLTAEVELPSTLITTDIPVPRVKTEPDDDMTDLEDDSTSNIFQNEQPEPMSSSLPPDDHSSEPDLPQTPLEVVNIESLSYERRLPGRKKQAKLYTCHPCIKFFPTYGKYLQHKRINHAQQNSSASGNIRCDFCHMVHLTTRDKRRHMKAVHIMELHSDLIPPGTTEREIQTATKLVTDKHKKYSGNEFGCPYCPKRVTIPQSLRLHVLEQHFDKVLIAVKNPSHRSLKAKKIKHKTIKKTNMKVKKKPKKSEVKCPQCDKTIRNKYALSNHLLSVHSEAKFSCSSCNLSFRRQTNLELHSIRKHTVKFLEKELPPGTTKYKLEDAIKSYLVPLVPLPPEGLVQCPFCEKGFRRKYHLRDHLLISHMEKITARLLNPVPAQPSKKFGKSEEIVQRPRSPQGVIINKCIQHPKSLFWICVYCEKSVVSKKEMRNHMKFRHTVPFLESKLPLGTTDEEMETAIRKVLESEKTYKGKDVPRNGCPLCGSNSRCYYQARRHVLRVHFQNVLECLQGQLK